MIEIIPKIQFSFSIIMKLIQCHTEEISDRIIIDICPIARYDIREKTPKGVYAGFERMKK